MITSPAARSIARFRPVGAIFLTLSTIEMGTSEFAAISRIFLRESSVDIPSATMTSIRSFGYVWRSTDVSPRSMNALSLRIGRTMDTNGRELSSISNFCPDRFRYLRIDIADHRAKFPSGSPRYRCHSFEIDIYPPKPLANSGREFDEGRVAKIVGRDVVDRDR